MPINKPYTPEIFEDMLAGTSGDYQQSWRNYQVGGTVKIIPGDRCHFRNELNELGYPEDVEMTIQTLLVGDLSIFDEDMGLVDKRIRCLLNCRLPHGEILSANSHFFEVVSLQSKQ